MANDIEESSNRPPVTPSSTETSNIDAGDFECNICFDLAQDPIVTLCGHLFCWPCLYRWLHHHSHCQECPVCKALVEEDKLVPLYGRVKSHHTDPRSKPIPGTEVPRRPMGQRPQTASPPEASSFRNVGLGHMGGFVPMATARFGNFAFSAGFGGLFPSIFNIQVHGYPNGNGYGTRFPHGFSGGYHGFHGPRAPNTSQGVRENNVLKNIFIVIGLLVIFSLIWG
ncbi:uncharacterized protein LOC141718792 [Apium graveolens]|uniref:uncharacterized protein LOC141718792 n=1 Tax=Apium graveolens TaxID=4045 RepID=UPI003D799C9B